MFLFLFEFLFVLVKPFQINARADFNPVISFVGDNYTGLPYCAFYMDAFASFSIVNGTFISNTGDDINPGAIRTSGNEPVLISNTYFENNKGTFEGGAIYIEVIHFEINQCTFIQNKCYTESTLNSNGGAIFVRSQSNFIQTIDSCIFIENSAKTYGGSIFIDFPSYSYNLSIITNCNFSYSQSESSGGAIASNHSDVINEGTSSEFRIENCEFESCFSQTGGSIFLTDFETKLDQKIVCNCRFKNETATHHGGAIVSYAPSVEIYESSFVECMAGNNDLGVGGALFLGQPPSGEIDLVQNCTFTRCSSSQAAGCLFAYCIRSSADRNAAVIVRSCNFTDCNSIEEGGAIASGHVSSFGGNNKIEVEDCFFTNCEAGKGGAFHSMSGTAETNEETQISNCTFVNCFASDSSHEGYAIYCRSYKICIENCQFNDHRRANDSKSRCIVYVETDEKITPAINFLHFESNTGVASLILYTIQNITMEGLTFNEIIDNIPCINLDNWRVGGDLYIKNSFFSNILISPCITTTTKVKTFTTYLEGCQFINISTRKNIRGPYISGCGSSIFCLNKGNLIVSECNFTNNVAEVNGGAIYAESDAIDIENCQFVLCSAGANEENGLGGAVFLHQTLSGGYDIFIQNYFFNCSASYGGGGLFIYCRDVYMASEILGTDFGKYGIQIYSCNFTDCTSGFEGGAISSGILNKETNQIEGDNDLQIRLCVFTRCESAKGGALYFQDGTPEGDEETSITSCNFTNCYASGPEHEGYSIYCRSYRINIGNCVFREHKRGTNIQTACIVYVETNEHEIAPEINLLTFEDNTGVSGLVVKTIEITTIRKLTFNNITDNLPCINLDNWDTKEGFIIINSDFTNIKDARCIFTSTGMKKFPVTVDSCRFINNSIKIYTQADLIHSGCGSSILCQNRKDDEEQVNIENCNFTNNDAESYGGAIYAETNTIDLNGCRFELCTSGVDNEEGRGGGVYMTQESGESFEQINENTFINCHASHSGGGLFIFCHDIETRTIKENNKMTRTEDHSYTIIIAGSKFINCSSVYEGGAISSGLYNDEAHKKEGDNDMQISGCQFFECESAKGGALYFQDGTIEGDEDTSITSCNFTNCYASGPEHEGYSIYCRSYRITIGNCVFREHKRGTSIQTACIVYVETNEAEVAPEINYLTFEENSGVSGLVVKTIEITTIRKLTFNNIIDNLPCINLDNWDTIKGVIIINSDFTNIKDARCIFTSSGMKKIPVIIDSCRFINNSIKIYTQADLIHSGCGSSILCQNRKDANEQVRIVNCNFTNNDAESYGGAIYAETNTIDLNGCRFELCTSGVDNDEGRGGGVYLTQGSGESFELQINENTFINCHASHSGGGLFIFCHDAKTRTIKENNKMAGKEFYLLILDNDFAYCQSKSGGGALCISSFYPSFIEGCKFESNMVQNGTGGAVYINPDTENKLESCSISNCSFLSNKAKDGFAICIDGNDNDTIINISLNKFIDNYNIETINDSFIISLEVCCVSRQRIISENTFSNQENGENIKVNEFSCFDSQYSLTFQFSESDYFSKSLKFTDSNDFSETNIFSQSEKFSQSNGFNEPNIFSQSAKFSQSKIFSESNIFSQSGKFSQSKIFSESNIFSQSEKFSQSKIFSESNIFSQSEKFSQSKIFSESNFFSQSEGLEKSDDLSQPSLGTSSDLSISTASQFFSLSMKFSQTNFFTKSREFTISTLKEILDEESFFSGSNGFTNSISSSFNDFESPIQLSTSKSFSPSDSFTYSKEFTYSIEFSESKSFSSFFAPFNTPKNSKYLSLFLSYVSLRSVTFSLTVSPSFLYTNFLMPNGEYTIGYTQIYIDRYLPYIIQFLSPTYIPVEILVELRDVKKKVTQEQLIGIVCGSAACFFGIIGIIILIVRKKKAIKAYDDYSISSEITKEAEPRNQAENDKNLHEDNDDEIDLDFWL